MSTRRRTRYESFELVLNEEELAEAGEVTMFDGGERSQENREAEGPRSEASVGLSIALPTEVDGLRMMTGENNSTHGVPASRGPTEVREIDAPGVVAPDADPYRTTFILPDLGLARQASFPPMQEIPVLLDEQLRRIQNNSDTTRAELGTLDIQETESPRSSLAQATSNEAGLQSVDGTSDIGGISGSHESNPYATGDIDTNPESLEFDRANSTERILGGAEEQQAIHTSNGATSPTEASEGSTSLDAGPPVEESLIFSRGRREGLMRQMAADISHYSRERETSFEQEHGFSRYSPVHTPEAEQSSDSSRLSSLESLSDSEIPQLVRVALSSPQVDRPVPFSPDAHDPPRAEGPSRRAYTLVSTLPLIHRVPPSSPAHEFPDPAEDFLRWVISEFGVHGELERGTRYDELTLFYIARFRFSLVFQDLQQHDAPTAEAIEEFETRRHQVFATADIPWVAERHARMMARIMRLARRDGLDVREGKMLMSSWQQFWLDRGHKDKYYSPPAQLGADILSPAALLFWVALRRGWGAWKPSQDMLRNVRQDVFGMCYDEHSYLLGDMTPEVRGLEIVTSIQSSDLPAPEQARLVRVFSSLPDDRDKDWRMKAIFARWRLIKPYVDRLRGEEEAHFSSAQIHLDRLERLIREESVINARMVLRNPIFSTDDL